MADLVWLSDEQWAVIEPVMPRDQPGPERKDDRQFISLRGPSAPVSCTWSRPAAAGVTARRRMGRAPPSTTGSTGGPAAASGKPCSPRWPRLGEPATRPPSIALMCGPTARPTAEKGAKAQAIGRLILSLSKDARRPDDQDPRLPDVLGRPGVLLLTPGNASDVTTMPAVLAEAPGRIRRLAADKGYDADWLRTDLRAQSITPVIPGKRGRKRRIRHDKRRSRER